MKLAGLKIALVVPGKFHAFDLGRALSEKGHDVCLLTNYPRWKIRQTDVGNCRLKSFWLHGGLVSLNGRFSDRLGTPRFEGAFKAAFGRWAAGRIREEKWDVIHCWSGVSKELLESGPNHTGLTLLMRGSAHIRVQDRLLAEEEQRTGSKIQRPSEETIEREETEYRLADRICVLSSFAKESFIGERTSPEKLVILPLGADLRRFHASLAANKARRERILSGKPLRVLYLGTLSYQKGFWDMVKVVQALGAKGFQFQFVGYKAPEVRSIFKTIEVKVNYTPSQPVSALPHFYDQADVFLLPTIQDGYAVVLDQARAAGLPIITTPHCAGPDLIEEGKNGWICPIRSPEALIEKLRWCGQNRALLAEMAQNTYSCYQPRDWSEVAEDFEKICFNEPAAGPRHPR